MWRVDMGFVMDQNNGPHHGSPASEYRREGGFRHDPKHTPEIRRHASLVAVYPRLPDTSGSANISWRFDTTQRQWPDGPEPAGDNPHAAECEVVDLRESVFLRGRRADLRAAALCPEGEHRRQRHAQRGLRRYAERQPLCVRCRWAEFHGPVAGEFYQPVGGNYGGGM